MMTEDQIVTEILRREGGAKFTDLPTDNGGPTKFGVTAATLGAYRNLGRPATRSEVQQLTESEARSIYRKRYISGPGFIATTIAYEPLRIQLIDFGVNSGPPRAIRWLQRVLHVPVTSVLDRFTRDAIAAAPGYLVNDALVAARCFMLDQATDDGTIHKANEEGLESRALSFFVSRESLS